MVTATAPGASTEIGTVFPFSAISGAVRSMPDAAASAPPVIPIINSFVEATEIDGMSVDITAAPPIAIVSRLVTSIILSFYSVIAYSFKVKR